MQLKNMKYFVMDGITVTNSRAYGIYTENSQYITAKNCEVAYPLDGGLIWKDSSNILVDSVMYTIPMIVATAAMKQYHLQIRRI
jgi:hypothetical protein